MPAQIAQCACQTQTQTPEQILQSCLSYIHQRNETWPHERSLQSKLWGTPRNSDISFIEAGNPSHGLVEQMRLNTKKKNIFLKIKVG
uniref:Uncharacterized protein n=1 Tax=Arion vulgaris TaxID=1028688 RepID=A0A0B7BL86_9EUPU